MFTGLGLCSSGAKYHQNIIPCGQTHQKSPQTQDFPDLILQSLSFVLNLLACVPVTTAGGKGVTQGWEGQAGRWHSPKIGRCHGRCLTGDTFCTLQSTGVGHQLLWKYNTGGKRASLGVLEHQGPWKYPKISPKAKQNRSWFGVQSCNVSLCAGTSFWGEKEINPLSLGIPFVSGS